MTFACPLTTNCKAETVHGVSLEFFRSMKDVQELQWNRHIPEVNHLMQYDQLNMIEETQKNSIEFRYVFVRQADVTVGVIYFQIVRFTGLQLINYFPDTTENTWRNYLLRPVKKFTEFLLKAIDVKLLVSGNVFMTGENGFYFHNNISKAERARIIRKAANEVLQQDKKIKAILISDLYEPKTEFDTEFPTMGYNELHVESDMSLTIRDAWKTFDDYLNAMSSKYRVRAKKVYALCRESHVTGRSLTVTEIREHEDQIFSLYQKVMDNADFRLAELEKGFFAKQKELMPDHYHLFAYFREQKMIGFISLYHFDKKIDVHYTGMDGEVTRPIKLYQHMMYDAVKFGIDNKAKQMHFGRTAPEIKSTIGAVPGKMYGYLKHKNPLFNRLIARPYTANLKPQDYTLRSPFK